MHAPINFGQYDYAGFMPQHPAVTRRLIPEDGSKEWEELQRNPLKFYLSSISDTDTTTTTMAVFGVVAAHAPNEEYIGQRSPTWTENEKPNATCSIMKSQIIVFQIVLNERYIAALKVRYLCTSIGSVFSLIIFNFCYDSWITENPNLSLCFEG